LAPSAGLETASSGAESPVFAFWLPSDMQAVMEPGKIAEIMQLPV
jgi:hypothetical protein